MLEQYRDLFSWPPSTSLVYLTDYGLCVLWLRMCTYTEYLLTSTPQAKLLTCTLFGGFCPVLPTHTHSGGPITFGFYGGKTLFAPLLYLVWNMRVFRIRDILARQCSSENPFIAGAYRKRDSMDTTYKATRILQDNSATLLLLFFFTSFSLSFFSFSFFLSHHSTLHRPPGLQPIGVTFLVNPPRHISSSELFMDSSSASSRFKTGQVA